MSTDRSDLVSALAGTQAGRDSVVANRTRRVVLASLGVMQDHRSGRRRGLTVALASMVLVVLALGPFIWRVVDDLIGGEHVSDIPTSMSLLICIFCPAMIAAVLVAGWARRGS